MGGFCSCLDNSIRVTPLFAETPTTPKTPIANQPELLDLPISSVAVMSSHNSYIRTLQHLGESSTDALRIVLDRGARCIELDVYRDPATYNVFVAHGKEELPNDIITTTKLSFEDAMSHIIYNAFRTTTDPLFIALELNVHNELAPCNRIADIIRRHAGPILYKGALTADTPLRDLVGKVVILTGGGIAPDSALNIIVHAQWNSVFQNTPSSTNPSNINGTNTCIRVYPEGNIEGALSLNFNPIPFLQKGATFVALNMCTDDAHMRAYATWFAQSSIVKKPLASA
jgi:hypothetical protein